MRRRRIHFHRSAFPASVFPADRRRAEQVLVALARLLHLARCRQSRRLGPLRCWQALQARPLELAVEVGVERSIAVVFRGIGLAGGRDFSGALEQALAQLRCRRFGGLVQSLAYHLAPGVWVGDFEAP